MPKSIKAVPKSITKKVVKAALAKTKQLKKSPKPLPKKTLAVKLPVVVKKSLTVSTSVKRKYMPLDPQVKNWMQDYFRYVNYLAAACLYLQDNVFLRKPLIPEQIKKRPLGHWGTVPGLNFIYLHANYLASKYQQKFIYLTGPGHGAPATLMNVYAEGTLGEYHKKATRDERGAQFVVKQFSWPYGFHSHATPDVPGSILEGGELGYSLSTAYGAVMDNPDLIALCVVGDGEAETGALATAWHGNKFLNPKESGAVLPVVHINGYKISGPTIYSTMSNEELDNMFRGFGYKPYIVDEEDHLMHECMADTMERAYQDIRAIWQAARVNNQVLKPQWPVIIMRSRKGWTGPVELNGKKILDNFRSHGLPVKNPRANAEEFNLVKNWLESYKIQDLIDSKGRPLPKLLTYIPAKDLRLGKVKNSYGGDIYRNLVMPKVEKFEFPKNKGTAAASSPAIAAEWLNALMKDKKNYSIFRFFCPDETDSNKFGRVFDAAKGREYLWPVKPEDENIVTEGRVTEMLSEQTLQGFLQGYLMTGRHGIFVTYEAFAQIVASMVDQHCKTLKQMNEIKWRKPIASLNYVLSSNTWRQEHNGFSHENPGLISNTLTKNGKFASVFYPADGNSLMVTLEECFKRRNHLNVIAVGKTDLPQWLTVKQARQQQKTGIMIWDWFDPIAAKNPDLVFAASGDYMVQELVAALDLLKKDFPELKIRLVYVSEVTEQGLGAIKNPLNNVKRFEEYFTADKPVVYHYHGYPSDVRHMIFGMPNHDRFKINGYIEEGTTTTPFDMLVVNKASRYHAIIDAMILLQKDARYAAKAKAIIKKYEKKLVEHKAYILENSLDMPEITGWNAGEYYQTGGS